METIWTIEILGMNMLQFTFYVGMVLAVVLIAGVIRKYSLSDERADQMA